MKGFLIKYGFLGLALGLKLPIIVIGVYWVVVGLLIEYLVISGGEGFKVFVLILVFPILSGMLLAVPNRVLLRIPLLLVAYSFVLIIALILIWSPLIHKEVGHIVSQPVLNYSRQWLSIPFLCALFSALLFAGAKKHLG